MATLTKPVVVDDRDEARQRIERARAAGKRVGVVMTMGALHEGHLSLVRRSAQQCDVTVVTVFVNPTQFGPQEDFDKYPRQLDRDLEMLGKLSVDFVFAPQQETMYRPGHSTCVEPPGVAEPFEGKCRPGHFRGVATIVLKLLHVLPVHVAYFGQKDYQQYLVLRTMLSDLDVPIEVAMCPTKRADDGLALSSRNTFLNPDQRRRAGAIWQALSAAEQLVTAGQTQVGILTSRMREILRESQIVKIDYVAIADRETLVELRDVDRPAVALIAAHVAGVRLIDNLLITPSTQFPDSQHAP